MFDHPLRRRIMGGSPFDSHAAQFNQFPPMVVAPDEKEAPARPEEEPAQDAPVTPSAQIEGSVASALIKAAPESDERRELMMRWFAICEDIRAFVARHHEERIAALREELAAVLAAGREALEEWKRRRIAASGLLARANTQGEVVQTARLKLMEATSSRPSADSWPTAEELDIADRRVNTAQKELDRVVRRAAEINAERDGAEKAESDAQSRITELKAERDKLRAQIAGKSYAGPHGLQVPPGS